MSNNQTNDISKNEKSLDTNNLNIQDIRITKVSNEDNNKSLSPKLSDDEIEEKDLNKEGTMKVKYYYQ